MKLQISEILTKLKDFTGDGAVSKKVEWLRKNDSPTLRLLLQHNFDQSISYNLPEGDPPFKRNDAPMEMSESTLYAETRKLAYLWMQPSQAALNTLTKSQRQQIDELETLQEEHGRKLQEKIAEYREAEKKIDEAREEIEAARLRYTAAIEHAKKIMQEGQILNKEVADITTSIGATTQNILGTNAALRNQQAPPTERNIPKYRLEMQFVQLLESLHHDEADVLLAVKNKTLTKKYAINKDIVKKAFPELGSL